MRECAMHLPLPDLSVMLSQNEVWVVKILMLVVVPTYWLILRQARHSHSLVMGWWGLQVCLSFCYHIFVVKSQPPINKFKKLTRWWWVWIACHLLTQSKGMHVYYTFFLSPFHSMYGVYSERMDIYACPWPKVPAISSTLGYILRLSKLWWWFKQWTSLIPALVFIDSSTCLYIEKQQWVLV